MRWLPVLLCVSIAPAEASPLGDPAIERAVFAGATASHPTTLALNPATLMIARRGLHAYLTGAATHGALSIDRRTVDPETGDLEAGGSASASAGSQGGTVGVHYVQSKVGVGLQVAILPAERMPDGGDLLAYHSRGGSHRESYVAIGVATRWRRVALGVTGRWVRHDLALRFARDTALEAGRADVATAGLESVEAREEYRLDATADLDWSDSFTVSFGALIQVADDWWVGVAYHLPRGGFGAVEATGHVDATGAPREGSEELDGDTNIRFALPHRQRVGVRGRITRSLDAVGELRRDTSSRFTRYDVRMYGLELADAGVPELYPRPRGLRDLWALSAGVEQVDVGQRWRLGGRLGADTGHTADAELSPQQAYPWGLSADLGVQLRIAPNWAVQLGYGVRWSPSADSGRGAYDPIDRLDCIDSGNDIDTEACQAVRAGYALPTASGTYQRVDQVGRAALEFVWP